MDETYVGSKAKNKRLGKRGGVGRSLDDKAAVFGMVERGGRVLAYVNAGCEGKKVLGIVREKDLDISDPSRQSRRTMSSTLPCQRIICPLSSRRASPRDQIHRHPLC